MLNFVKLCFIVYEVCTFAVFLVRYVMDKGLVYLSGSWLIGWDEIVVYLRPEFKKKR